MMSSAPPLVIYFSLLAPALLVLTLLSHALQAAAVVQNTKYEDSLFSLLDLLPRGDRARLEKDRASIMNKVELFVELHPEVFRRKYKFRFWTHEIYPLAALVALGASQKILELVYDVHPAAGSAAVAYECNYAKTVDLLRFWWGKCPAAFSTAHPVTQRLPLHSACSGNVLLDVVQFVYEAYPQALAQKNRYGWTPLHAAFRHTGLATIKYFMETIDDDAVIKQKTKSGLTPLHLAFCNRRREVSEFVVKTFPNFLMEAKEDPSTLPLHIACNHEYTAGIEVLLASDPDAAKLQDDRGRLPLAIALKNEKFKDKFSVIELIARAHPDAIDAVDHAGNPAVDMPTFRKLTKYLLNQKAAPPAKRQRT